MSKKYTDEELLAQLDDLGVDDTTTQAPPPSKGASGKVPPTTVSDDKDPLADLDELEKELAAQPPSRSGTPRLTSSTASSKRTGVATPPSVNSGRTSEDKPRTAANLPRKSGESTRSFHQSFTPAAEPTPAEPAPAAAAAPQQSGGGWWGGLFATATATASAAVKQAEAAVKEIQKNEEAQKWAEQVRGNLNVGALRGLGGELRSRALPTFTNLLHTIAPPISQHERLQIHITHDLINYPSLDKTIYTTFSRVMSQVEGGDLLVIQRGSESSQRRDDSTATYSWDDGPWWRSREPRRLNAVPGLVEGTKLARVSAESYAGEFFAARGGVEEAARHATQVLSESNPVRSSDIFLAIQAVSHAAPAELFAGSSATEPAAGGVQPPADDRDELVSFAIFLHDPVHSIDFSSLSQPFPAKWAEWLDAAAPAGGDDNHASAEDDQLPPEIVEIVQSGGIDPREWVAEWLEEIIALAVGVVAQRYVARRMGVGEGGIGKGKARQAVVESGGGELARAGII